MAGLLSKQRSNIVMKYLGMSRKQKTAQCWIPRTSLVHCCSWTSVKPWDLFIDLKHDIIIKTKKERVCGGCLASFNQVCWVLKKKVMLSWTKSEYINCTFSFCSKHVLLSLWLSVNQILISSTRHNAQHYIRLITWSKLNDHSHLLFMDLYRSLLINGPDLLNANAIDHYLIKNMDQAQMRCDCGVESSMQGLCSCLKGISSHEEGLQVLC